MFRVLLSSRMLGLHLLAVLATGVALWLGVWQYGAWQAHRENQALDLASAPAVPLQQVMSNDDPFPGMSVGQPVVLSGVWVPDPTFYVSDKQLDGRDGFWVVTPVAVCGDHCTGDGAKAPAMLVVRGWTPSVSGAPAPPTGPVRVTGWLQPAEGSGLPDTHPRDDVLPELRIADAIQRVDQDLYGAYVMSKAHEPGLRPLTPAALPSPDAFTSLRNLLYAFQWWFFAGFAVYIWWRWVTDELARSRKSPDDGPDQGGDDAGGAGDGEPTGRERSTTPEVPSSA